MDEQVKATLGRLARAINDVLGQSAQIDDSVRALKDMGYEFTLYLEATLLLRRERAAGGGRTTGTRTTRRIRAGSLKLSERDMKFLKSLRISVAGRGAKGKKP